MTKKYGVQHIYFIDRAHKIFQTNLATDMNLAFPESDFTRFLDWVFGNDKVMSDGIDLPRSPARSGPTATSAPRERTTSSKSRPRSAPASPQRLRLDEQVLLREFIHRSGPLAPQSQERRHLPDQRLRHLVAASSPQEARSGARRSRGQGASRAGVSADGDTYQYSGIPRDGDRGQIRILQAGHPRDHLRYRPGATGRHPGLGGLDDRAGAAAAADLLARLATAAEAAAGPAVQPARRGRAIAEGDLDQAIANTGRRDEIGQLAKSFASMRDAVRRTILDLRETNISIERFVPQAFLAIVGKPSIVESSWATTTART